MLIPFGVFSAAGAGGGAAAGAYELIETTILSSAANSITFSSIPATYKHLQIRYTVQDSDTGTTDTSAYIRLNGDTGANYSRHSLHGTGSVVQSNAGVSYSNIDNAWIPSAGGTTGAWAGYVVDVLDYASTSKNKTVRSIGGFVNSGATRVRLVSGAWYNTAAVNAIQIRDANLNFSIGSRFSLYGIVG